MRFLIRLLTNAAALWVAAWIVPGVTYTGGWLPFLAVSLVFAVINATLRPLIKLLTCPLILLTLGLFALVVNGLMLWLTAAVARSRSVSASTSPASGPRSSADSWSASSARSCRSR